MTTFAMTSELNASCAQQDVSTLAIERFARRVAMQRLGPGRMRVLVATEAALSREELLDWNHCAAFSSGIGRAKQLLRRRRKGAFLWSIT